MCPFLKTIKENQTVEVDGHVGPRTWPFGAAAGHRDARRPVPTNTTISTAATTLQMIVPSQLFRDGGPGLRLKRS